MRLYKRVISKTRRISRSVKNIFVKPDRAVVLIYHRVCNLAKDPQMLAVSPVRFEAQIRHLKKHYNIISLQELIGHLSKGEVPHNTVVITFDDGYADNLYNAKPILEKYNVPATVFVTAGMLDSPDEYWCDELERIFLDNEIYKPLTLEIGTKSYQWDIRSKKDSLEVYNILAAGIKDIPVSERREKMVSIRNWAGISGIGRETHRFLTKDELIELSKGDLIEIGAHTMTHCALSAELPERQEWEINESKKVLEAILGKKVRSFSYPYGLLTDFMPMAPEYVRKAGFNCGIANEQQTIIFDTDLYKIPRRLVRNWDVNLFQDMMNSFFSFRPDVFEGLHNKWQVQTLPQKIYKRDLLPRVKRAGKVNKKNISGGLPTSMKILHINAVDNKGGAAKIACNLNQAINAGGNQSEMLVDRIVTDSDEAHVLERDNSHLQKLLWYAQQQNGWQDFFNLASFKIKDMELFKNSDIIHFHNLHSGYFSYFALPELTALKPAVWTLHDVQAITGHCSCLPDCDRWQKGCGECPDLSIYPALKRDTTAFLWQNKKEIFDSTDFTVVCPSKWLKDKVENSMLKDKDIRLIYNGINTDVFVKRDRDKTRHELGLPINKKILLFCAEGGIENSWKGGRYLQQACSSLQNRQDILFINIGGRANPVKDNNWIDVDYIYDETTLAKYYAAADLFIYPSLAESFGLVVAESMACGTPVVAFSVGGIPEIIRHMETGYLAEYRNVQDMIKGILYFLDNPEMSHEAGIKAGLEVSRKFSVNRMAEEYVKLYSECIEKSSAAARI